MVVMSTDLWFNQINNFDEEVAFDVQLRLDDVYESELQGNDYISLVIGSFVENNTSNVGLKGIVMGLSKHLNECGNDSYELEDEIKTGFDNLLVAIRIVEESRASIHCEKMALPQWLQVEKNTNSIF